MYNDMTKKFVNQINNHPHIVDMLLQLWIIQKMRALYMYMYTCTLVTKIEYMYIILQCLSYNQRSNQ